MSLIRNAFRRLHYPVDIIAQCVRWYLAYALSLRNLEEMMAERGILVDHSTLHRWVTRLVPLLDKAFRRHKRPVGRRWRMDETYIKVRGEWKYLYRAVDSTGQTIDFLLTARRDAAAALRLFRKAIRHHGEPDGVTIDKSGAYTAALDTLNAGRPEEETITIRSCNQCGSRISLLPLCQFRICIFTITATMQFNRVRYTPVYSFRKRPVNAYFIKSSGLINDLKSVSLSRLCI